MKKIFDQSISIFENDPRILGAFHSGSVKNGKDDEYSDVDPVFLVKEECFDEIDQELSNIFKKICSKIILCWPEGFNEETIRNYAFLLETDTVYQYDITIIKEQCSGNSTAGFFLGRCREEDIIFDKSGKLKNLISQHENKDESDAPINFSYMLYQIEKYWLFAYISVKYLIRKDVYKMIYARNEMFKTHLEVIRMTSGRGDWSWWPAAVNNNLVEDKKQAMLSYFSMPQISMMKEDYKKQIELFSKDARLLCESKNIAYPDYLESTILKYAGGYLWALFRG